MRLTRAFLSIYKQKNSEILFFYFIFFCFILNGCVKGSSESTQRGDLLIKTETKIIFSAKNYKGIFHLYLKTDLKKRHKIKTLFNNHSITPVFSPDGTEILFSEYDGDDYELMWLNIASGNIKQLTNNKFDDYAPTWSLDKKRIAWCRVEKMNKQKAETAEIFVSEWPNIKEHQLTKNSRMDAYPVFTNDNKKIIVESGKINSLFGLFIVYWEGKEEPIVYKPNLTGNGIPHIYKHFVLFERTNKNKPNHFDIFIFNLKTKKIEQLTKWNTPSNPSPRFSHDGANIASHRVNEEGSSEIVILSYPQKKETILNYKSGTLRLPRWNRDGNLLAAEDFKEKNLVVFDAQGNYNAIISDGLSYRGQKFMEIYNYDIY